MTKMLNTPQDFTERFPKYTYRNGNGSSQVQWREAALDMANDRANLVAALQSVIAMYASDQKQAVAAKALLRDLGEL